jgi:hypothetical protein
MCSNVTTRKRVVMFSGPPDEPRQEPRCTVNGRRQETPEEPGTLQRRFRLFGECVRRLAGEPLASPQAHGVPVGDGLGLEGLVAQIAPLFEREQSLIRWVALRGALADLYIHTIDPTSRSVPFYPTVEVVMGVGHLSDHDDPEEVIGVVPDWSDRLTEHQQQSAVNIYTSVWRRLLHYEHYSKMPIGEVNSLRLLQVGPAIGLDIIAWSAIAMVRLGCDYEDIPGPDELDEPGWYTEPVFGVDERYWDGSDWTERCRVRTGRRYSESTLPLC